MRYKYYYDKLKNKKTTALLLSITILGFLLRLYHLGYKSLVRDELGAVVRTDYTLVQTVRHLFGSEFPPLYYILMNTWMKFFGNSEFSLRFPSLIFSVLSIIFIFKLSKELFNKKAGLISALLLSVSPYSILFAQTAKMYSMLWCLSILSFFFFRRFIKNNEIRSLLSYVIFTTMSIYTMYVGFIFIIMQNILFFTFPKNMKKCKRWVLGQAAIILLYLPWIDKIFYNRPDIRSLVRGASRIDNYPLFIRRIFLETTGIQGGKTRLMYLEFFLYCFLIVSAIVYFRNIGQKKHIFDFTRNDYLLFVWIITPLIIYSIIDIFYFRIFLVRYAGFIHIPLIILFSKGLNRYKAKFKSALLLFLLFMIFSSHLYPYYNRPANIDWKGLANLLREKASTDALIFGNGIKEITYYTKNKLEIKPLKYLEEQKGIDEKYGSIFVIHKRRKTINHIKDRLSMRYELKGQYGFGQAEVLWFSKTQSGGAQIRKKKNHSAVYVDSEEKKHETTKGF